VIKKLSKNCRETRRDWGNG